MNGKTGYMLKFLKKTKYYEGYVDGIRNVSDSIMRDMKYALSLATDEQKKGIEIAIKIVESNIPLN